MFVIESRKKTSILRYSVHDNSLVSRMRTHQEIYLAHLILTVPLLSPLPTIILLLPRHHPRPSPSTPRPLSKPPATSPPTIHPCRMKSHFPIPNGGARRRLLTLTVGSAQPVISLCPLGGATPALLTTPQLATVVGPMTAPRTLLLRPLAIDGHKCETLNAAASSTSLAMVTSPLAVSPTSRRLPLPPSPFIPSISDVCATNLIGAHVLDKIWVSFLAWYYIGPCVKKKKSPEGTQIHAKTI